MQIFFAKCLLAAVFATPSDSKASAGACAEGECAPETVLLQQRHHHAVMKSSVEKETPLNTPVPVGLEQECLDIYGSYGAAFGGLEKCEPCRDSVQCQSGMVCDDTMKLCMPPWQEGNSADRDCSGDHANCASDCTDGDDVCCSPTDGSDYSDWGYLNCLPDTAPSPAPPNSLVIPSTQNWTSGDPTTIRTGTDGAWGGDPCKKVWWNRRKNRWYDTQSEKWVSGPMVIQFCDTFCCARQNPDGSISNAKGYCQSTEGSYSDGYCNEEAPSEYISPTPASAPEPEPSPTPTSEPEPEPSPTPAPPVTVDGVPCLQEWTFEGVHCTDFCCLLGDDEVCMTKSEEVGSCATTTTAATTTIAATTTTSSYQYFDDQTPSCRRRRNPPGCCRRRRCSKTRGYPGL